jgi:hypothetical protein
MPCSWGVTLDIQTLKISTKREFVFPDSSISFGDYYANIDDKDDTFGTKTLVVFKHFVFLS